MRDGIQPDKDSPKPRKLGVRQKENRVCQAAGYRMALLELWPLIKDEDVREEIRKRGNWADSVALENGGLLFRSFDQSIAEVEAQLAKS